MMGNYHVPFSGANRAAMPVTYPVPTNIHKTHMKSPTLSILFLMVLILSGCVHVEFPHSGVVKDAETGDPVKGVVVHMDLETSMPLDHGSRWKDSYETVTNAEGKYSLKMKLKGQLPLEISTGHELTFFKAGYFPSRILDPSLNNTVTLYPIKYYLDLAHYKEKAEKGGLDPYFIDKKPEAFTRYKKELIKLTSLQFERCGDKGVFIEVPDAQFRKLSCRTTYDIDENYSKAYTFGISRNVCVSFDEYSRKTITFDAQGNIKELTDNLLKRYDFFSAAPNEKDNVYANDNSIYVPNPPYLNIANNVVPQKGHIIALAGDSDEYLTLEGNGLFLCYYSIFHKIGMGCISADDIFPDNDRNSGQTPRFVSITHGYSPAIDHDYFVISKDDLEYRIHKVTYESGSSGKTIFNLSEQFLGTFTADDEIIDFASDGRIFFIAFKKGGVKKYTLDMYRRGSLKEEKAFYKNSYGLFLGNRIAAVKLGRLVSERALYVTVGNSKVYRLSLEGVPDYRIRIKGI